MSQLPKKFLNDWENREPLCVLTTVDRNQCPNSVWVLCIQLFLDHHFLIANNYFHKTVNNIQNESLGALLMITPERESYQIKGELNIYTEGEYFETAKKIWPAPEFPVKSAVTLSIQKIYAGEHCISEY
jgi:predicted pyridoxine 5'-phosphate oxidase superfamily flavin-nucleotide-binding protein